MHQDSERVLLVQENMSVERARAKLSVQGYRLLSPARLLRRAPADALRGIERVYVPNWLFRLEVEAARGRQEAVSTQVRVIVDALSGESRVLPDDVTVGEVEVDDWQDAKASANIRSADAETAATQAMRWHIVRTGKIHVRRLHVIAGQPELAYRPAWLGYFSDDRGHLRVRCMNGVDGAIENATYAIGLLRGLPESRRTPQV